MNRKKVTIDGNTAAAHTAYHLNEVVTIYPITPSSGMGELADLWAAEGKPNIWGTVPQITEMQSEGGASGATHGSLQRGALTTTFTASQGLLLMIPNMFKIAGELTSTVFNVAARSVACQALSIFGDHSDVMATRGTGFALLASNSVQEAMDFPLIAQAATLESRVPFLHFFDGFRTSHEESKVELLTPEDMRSLINDDLVRAHRKRALSPDRPFIRGTAQNPDVFFQARETVNSYYLTCPDLVQKVMDKFEKVVGRRYELFQYFGAEDAEIIIVLMGSGAETAEETVEYLMKQGEKVGLIKVRLYRPFSVKHFINSLPRTVKIISTLDRTKEPGSIGEPLYTDIVTAIQEGVSMGISHFKDTPKIIGGRYGLSSKEFTPAMIKGLFDEMKKDIPKNHFTIGINDDLTHTSISYNPDFSIEPTDRTRAVFYGLGSDGTVGANKNSIKIIGEETDNYAQGYFVYDSRKAGSLTISHLRFGPTPIHSTYLVNRANFVACHQFSFLERYDVLKTAQPGAVFLLNSPYSALEVWDHLPYSVQQTIIEKKLRLFVIDAFKIAKEVGLGGRINTIMQVCFFSLSNIIPIKQATKAIKNFIEKTYGQKGEKIVNTNFAGVDNALTNLHEVKIPDKATEKLSERSFIPVEAPEFVKKVTAKIIAGEGDDLPVSVFSPDGTFPSGTTQWEKRNIAQEIPTWDPNACIQCGKCVMVCPHAVIRAKVYDPKLLSSAPHSFKSVDPKNSQFKGMKFTLQVSPEDCTGCGLCVENCPAKNKTNPHLKAINMVTQPPIREQEVKNWEFFLEIPEVDRRELKLNAVRNVQYLQPLFEFSGACAGCGETPYVKLLSQLFGDRAVIANATGCSSIYGGNLPTTPWTFNKEGRGPAWSNSLFEDNAEFGLGMRLALDKQVEYAFELVDRLSSEIGDDLVREIKNADQSTERGLQEQRDRVKVLEKKLKKTEKAEAEDLLSLIDVLAKKSVWIVGGDGWAYDIGYGGLDHVIAQRRKVNILVLDSETYSNTGGQMSKATPLGAIAKFAASGKRTYKKDLAMMAISYGDVYVARVAMGANDAQVIKAFQEAEAFNGPSLIIAYSHCISHGYNLVHGLEQQKLAVQSGYWPLLRYNPDLTKEGKNPFQLDSKAPSIPLEEYVYNENRYKMLTRTNPEVAKKLLKQAQEEVLRRWKMYEYLAALTFEKNK
ncbi:MAG: pyruvate:ferredoxin (flavodoxin) oxidoreductase [Candidatus Infernicultor aquiphilus]|uniref:Pyruvate:ferredoxin (Flavodoxin) oxidoreductase n=1 Tax=Candidatus Infernicultor aquiphilus TaxID=1805029 RepID=A0A1J5H3Z2_9BACT|nr:pyruvate:ferredoxin (flavodoxin) oxidoreductase [bacterium]OIP74790.1 MAG: pyruvate:ferredoxin (flavodoxin) oxidoreductase [Candidatus Atribacteria bacterium CG2_30_33_13]PIU25859.1 MAG: pyruvate:ferredoxin (flavodoxin) oxidoreductase [Candidatus Atribacteria bacterium CG08_land_8_20_14_0_20_33_29]PIW11374.1 MAG: pyruvate:ferredoxin (flavodoxin) oxidoreductase [Candidatus Atribacteria bacterium CG17_big_fil_post_rev_8_21_14_2_50_34_11]PIX33289.1 MAG: pyruvate:ferredoxin (flavodoxin) oxidored